MSLDGYILSDFGKSNFFSKKIDNVHYEAKVAMTRLIRQKPLGNVLARVASPFVGAGTLFLSLCLRVASVVEPIIGILADIGAAIWFREPRPLVGILFRLGAIGNNLVSLVGAGLMDVVRIGIGVGVGGVFAPSAASTLLSSYVVSNAD